MRYVRPNSLTWWAGLLAMLTGIASLALPATGPLGERQELLPSSEMWFWPGARCWLWPEAISLSIFFTLLMK